MRDDRLSARLAKLFGLLGSNNAGERENARSRINEMLRKHRKSWNDLTALLQTGCSDSDWGAATDDQVSRADDPAEGLHDTIDLVHRVLLEYVDLRPDEYVAVTLWILHAHLLDLFMISPRLALLSPVRGCGKTMLLDVIDRLLSGAQRADGVSAASIYWLVDRERRPRSD